MSSVWRGVDKNPPYDEDIKVVETEVGVITLARYLDDMWVDEYTNRMLRVVHWMPIPILPSE